MKAKPLSSWPGGCSMPQAEARGQGQSEVQGEGEVLTPGNVMMLLFTGQCCVGWGGERACF